MSRTAALRLASEFQVRQTTACTLAEYGREAAEVSQLAQIEREHALVQVAEQVEWLDADVGAVQSALEKRPEVLHVVRVNLPIDVPLGVIDNAMIVVGFESGVRTERICVNGCSRLNRVANDPVQRGALGISDDLSTNKSAALDHADNGGLIRAARAGDLPSAFPLVHVPRLAADVSLVHFNRARKLVEAPALHGEPDAVKHEPRRLLSNAERPAKFVRADPVLGVSSKPHGREPLVESECGVLKDRPEFDRELALARLAFPDTPSGQVGVLDTGTARANGLAVPTEIGDKLGANIEVREVADRFKQVLGGLRCAHVGELTTSRQVCQVYHSPN
jgi:hypothetical protein